MAQALRNDDRGTRVESGQQDDELLAAEAVDGLAATEPVLEALGDVLEDLVADDVAVLVVDRLEAVEVADEHRDAAARGRRLVGELDDAGLERGAVQHARQLVDDGRRPRLDVGDRRDHAEHRDGDHEHDGSDDRRRDAQHEL